jgi:hypothetical protein
MAVTPSFRDYVLEQLAGLGRVRPHRMLGGVAASDDFFRVDRRRHVVSEGRRW